MSSYFSSIRDRIHQSVYGADPSYDSIQQAEHDLEKTNDRILPDLHEGLSKRLMVGGSVFALGMTSLFLTTSRPLSILRVVGAVGFRSCTGVGTMIVYPMHLNAHITPAAQKAFRAAALMLAVSSGALWGLSTSSSSMVAASFALDLATQALAITPIILNFQRACYLREHAQELVKK